VIEGASIVLEVMASTDDAASSRFNSTVKESRASEDRLAALLKENPQLILIKFFVDLSKKEAPPKESVDPLPLIPPTAIPDDVFSSTEREIPTSSDSTLTGFTDYQSD
jgi:hypothetical protein